MARQSGRGHRSFQSILSAKPQSQFIMTTLPVPASAPASIQDNERIGHLPQALQDALAAAKTFALSEKSDATRRAYKSDYDDFERWCSQFELPAMPASPAAVASYLATLPDRRLRASTIARRVAALSYAHRLAGHDDPTQAGTVKAVLRGIKRKLGTRARKKAPLTADLVVRAVKKIPDDTLIGQRDRALLLTLFGAALRRSELVALDIEHLDFRPQGVVLTIARSKADQEGRGQTVAIPSGSKLKVPDAIKAWIKAAGIQDGPVFRGVAKGGRVLPDRLCDKQVARIVKQAVARIGLDPDLFSGHSLRSGYASTAGRKDLVGTAAHLRHAKVDTTRGYIQEADAFANHSGKGFL
jgi:integrase